MSNIQPISAAKLASMGVRGVALSGDVDAPALEISRSFLIQSYFDTTLMQGALLEQSPTESVVKSTAKSEDLAGYAVALHPSSDTPIAIQFKTGQQQGNSGTFRLKPGEYLRPFGSPNGRPGRFSGFTWGLPFGWLGGGNANLIVFRTSDASVAWGNDHSEMLFHRLRLPIYQPAAVPNIVTGLIFNWPTRFPWAHGIKGSNSLPQSGQPILSVFPTRTLLKLIKPGGNTNLAAAADMRCLFLGADSIGTDSAGAITVSGDYQPAVDVTWGTWTTNGAFANYTTQTQVKVMTDDEWTGILGCNDGALVLVDNSGAQLLDGFYVDIARYGRL